MSALRFSREARADLSRIRRYLLKHRSPRAARKIWDNLSTALRYVAEHPEACRRRYEFDEFGVSYWSHAAPPYVIYYRNDEPVYVSRVLHGRENVEIALAGP